MVYQKLPDKFHVRFQSKQEVHTGLFLSFLNSTLSAFLYHNPSGLTISILGIQSKYLRNTMFNNWCNFKTHLTQQEENHAVFNPPYFQCIFSSTSCVVLCLLTIPNMQRTAGKLTWNPGGVCGVLDAGKYRASALIGEPQIMISYTLVRLLFP